MKPTTGARGGFTLVELLVVVGIIAVLIAILLPALSKARQQAITVQCLSNLRQMGLACTSYSNESAGIIVPGAYSAPGDSSSPAVRDFWFTALAAAGYAPNTLTSTNAPLTKSMFYCPAARLDTSPSRPLDHAKVWASNILAPGKYISCAYGMNADDDVKYHAPSAVLPIKKGATSSMTYAKLSAVREASRMVYILDGYCIAFRVENSATKELERIDARHQYRTKTNILFFDGHAATYSHKDLPNKDIYFSGYGPDASGLNANFPELHWRTDQ